MESRITAFFDRLDRDSDSARKSLRDQERNLVLRLFAFLKSNGDPQGVPDFSTHIDYREASTAFSRGGNSYLSAIFVLSSVLEKERNARVDRALPNLTPAPE